MIYRLKTINTIQFGFEAPHCAQVFKRSFAVAGLFSFTGVL